MVPFPGSSSSFSFHFIYFPSFLRQTRFVSSKLETDELGRANRKPQRELAGWLHRVCELAAPVCQLHGRNGLPGGVQDAADHCGGEMMMPWEGGRSVCYLRDDTICSSSSLSRMPCHTELTLQSHGHMSLSSESSLSDCSMNSSQQNGLEIVSFFGQKKKTKNVTPSALGSNCLNQT